MGLTRKQLKVYDAVQTFLMERRVSPSIREICELVGLKSPSTVQGYLCRLKEAGLVEWKAGQPRTLRILDGESL